MNYEENVSVKIKGLCYSIWNLLFYGKVFGLVLSRNLVTIWLLSLYMRVFISKPFCALNLVIITLIVNCKLYPDSQLA